ncbi:MAG: PAS domain-containing protein [Deltaproteobacteria bacterium]|nr:PAS domain-containing protein [Deltaproteobacteria bacterium]
MVNERAVRPEADKSTAIDSHTGTGRPPALVVGIGAAAGALKSLRKILSAIPSGQGVAVVLAYHPQLSERNILSLLNRQIALSVVEATDGMTIWADRIHVMPPDYFLNMAADRLTLQEPVHCNGLLMPIDHFFCALAADRGDRCCGVLLSGEGSDGTLGLSEIRAAGGRTVVEDPEGAPFPDMPQSAIEAGTVDTVLPAESIAGEVAEWARWIAARHPGTVFPKPESGFGAILEILRSRVGQDFRGYKTNALERRIRRRMALARIPTMEDYARHLSDQPDEVSLLRQDLLIGVTEFFRQPQAWEILERKVIAPLIRQAAPDSLIRVWTPGCASGREVYSLAMLLAEQARVTGGEIDFQIFATDADAAALAAARTGIYTPAEIGHHVTPERLERFFSRRDDGYQVAKALRNRIVFAVQNLTADPPFSRLDLVVCRNVLIYLDQSMQKRVVSLFHFALHDGGFLFLGNAETIGEMEDLFEPISKKWRIYRRIGVGRRTAVEIPIHPAGIPCTAATKSASAALPRQSLASAAQQALLSRFAPACVLIDRRLQTLYSHGVVENYLTLPAGELTTRVVEMARKELRTRLRTAIGRCIQKGRSVSFTASVPRGRRSVMVKTTVSPLKHPRGIDGLLLITFEDQRATSARSDGQTPEQGDICQLTDELRVTREELQNTIGQLEGTNEQLKASNEEVTAANEELQSANEEMETSKEELQSLNDELNTTNLRLQEKVEELEIVNNDVLNFLTSTNIATVFLDKAFRIKRYTPAVTRLMSLIPSDTGRPIGDVLMRFTDESLMDDARRVLSDLVPLAAEVRSDDGRSHVRRIMPYRTHDDRIEGVVITFVDVTDLKTAEEGLRESGRRLAQIMDSIADGFFALDRQWRFTHINDEALAHFRKTAGEVIGRTLFEVFPGIRDTAFETRYRLAMESGEPVHFEIRSTVDDMMMEIHAYPGPESLTVLFRNVTERYRMVEALQEAHQRAAWLARFPEENPNPVVRASVEGTVLYANPAASNRSTWSCRKETLLPEELRPLVAQAMEENREIHQDIRMGERVYAVSVTPFRGESYANLYGRDITKRTLAEAALRDSELKAATLLDAAGESIWLFGLDGDILAANTTAARRMGKTVGEVVGTKWGDLMNAELRKSRGEKITEVVRTGKPIRFEDERAGIVFDHAFYPARDAAGNIMGVAAFSRDVTERKRMEEALQTTLQRFYTMLSSMISGILLVGNTGLIEYANPAFCDYFGLTAPPDSFTGRSAGEFTEMIKNAYLDPDKELARIREILAAGVPVIAEEIAMQGGRTCLRNFIPIDVDGKPYGRLWHHMDITARKRAEEALRQLNVELEARVTAQTTEIRRAYEATRMEKQRFNDVLEMLPVYVVLLTPDYHVSFANRTFRERFGEGPGKRCYEHLFGRTEPCEICETYTVLQTREPHRWEWTGPDSRDYDVYDFPFTDSEGAPFILEMGIDCTEIKRAEAALREANETLERRVAERTAELIKANEALNGRSEQLAAANRELESFSYSVSHDLQAPLRAIEGYSRMILKKHAERFDEDALAKFNVIRANAKTMSRLIEDLLAFSRLGKTHLSTASLDMEVMFREVWEEIRSANPERHLKLKLGALPQASGDRALIRQVLLNLLSNAVKFTRQRPEALIEVQGSREDSECIYRVRDNGVGFDMAYHDKMFGVFQRLHTNEEFEGTGVGLAIVQRIIHRHGGRVWAEGKLGQGACFYFSLPSANGITSVH